MKQAHQVFYLRYFTALPITKLILIIRTKCESLTTQGKANEFIDI